MTSPLLSLLFDMGLAILLIATIAYCSKLSRRISMLQDSSSELANMINRFDSATDRAMGSLAELQHTSQKITDALQMKIEKANFLADDLAFLIEKSTKLAAQLEQTKQRESIAAKPIVRAEPKPMFEPAVLPLTKPKPAEFYNAPRPAAKAPTSSTSVSSLEAVLQRLATSAGSPSSAKPAYSSPSASDPRTEAERELIEALRSGH